MRAIRKKPCSICRGWFRPAPRVFSDVIAHCRCPFAERPMSRSYGTKPVGGPRRFVDEADPRSAHEN